jgi:DNA-binding NarL/FixJ family response regulator
METIAICDMEPIAIEGLRSLLGSVEGIRVVAAGTSLADTIESVRDSPPRVVVIDKVLGIPAVIEWVKSLCRGNPPTAIVIWGAAMSEVEALRFLQAGASGVVRKTAPLDVLLECVLAVAAGHTWVEEQILGETDHTGRPAHSPLTARESQVMELVERGMKNRDIGSTLGIRTGTVKIHLKHIFEKTGIRGRYGLALSGLKEKGLLAVRSEDAA